MNNKIVLSLYENSRNAVIGNIVKGPTRLMATTHPATIAAAIFAMDESTIVFKTDKGEAEFAFPFKNEDFGALASLLDNLDQVVFMSGFATFSHFDFLHPAPFDDQAEIHHRVAAHHLGEQFVRIAPMSPPPKGFKRQLRARNCYVYYPYC